MAMARGETSQRESEEIQNSCAKSDEKANRVRNAVAHHISGVIKSTNI